jgi:hypothetical protein
VRSRRTRSTTDTRENRFVVAVLEQMLDVCRRVASSARIAQLASGASVVAEAAGCAQRLERWRRHPVLQPLSAEFAPPAHSTVLRGRAGYRHLAQFYMDLVGRTRLLDSDVARRTMDLRDAATIYETWCYLTVVRTLEALTGDSADLAPFKDDAAAVFVPGQHVARVGDVRVEYNRTFPASGGHGRQHGRSYSVKSNTWGSRYSMLDDRGAVCAEAERVGRKHWAVLAGGRTYEFRRPSIWSSDQLLVDGEHTVGVITRPSAWRGDLAADLPGLPLPVQVFVLGVLLTNYSNAAAAAG